VDKWPAYARLSTVAPAGHLPTAPSLQERNPFSAQFLTATGVVIGREMGVGFGSDLTARVRRGMLQLAWGFLLHQKHSPLTDWYRARTTDARSGTRKTMIVALARKLLIALWRLVTTGEAPQGWTLRPT
jgi:hypothetical protein